MIEVNIISTCDRCKNIIDEKNDLFKIKREKVDRSYIKQSTAFPYMLSGNGIYQDPYDQYKTYHICEKCSEDLFSFMEPSA